MKTFTNSRSLIEALAKTMNLINPALEHHHEQTAYFAWFIGREMGFDEKMMHLTVYSAILHDVGSVILGRVASIEEIETAAEKYARIGADMLRDLSGFQEIAEILEYCQTPFARILACRMTCPESEQYLRIASVIHLADTVSLLMQEGHILNQVEDICGLIEQGKGQAFMPEAVEALLRIRNREVLWLDAYSNPSFLMYFTGAMNGLSLKDTVQFTQLFSRIIDYRSPFTAMHSAGVSASATTLARLCGMDADDCLKMEIAGNLHDIGKLVVPTSILEKPGKLTDEEFNIIKEHTYYTRLILMDVEGFGDIANWAGFHHEKLHGNGYPFHITSDKLDLGDRILAVADVFSAITEERPYRKGMPAEQVEKIMRGNADRRDLDADIVGVLLDNYGEVNEAREAKSREQGQRYFASLAKENSGGQGEG